MSDSAAVRPAICLNMIVRNEAHIVREVLDSVAAHITSWVIVDTGSDDGTQALIRDHMASLGIPGQLHERPWRNFGHNRSEALTLAQGHGDYIWVMDADDRLAGTPDFSGLTADIYLMRVDTHDVALWRPHLFRNGLPVRYQGVVHEALVCDEPCTTVRLEGEYHIDARSLGARSQNPQTVQRDRDLLLAEVQHNPEDSRSVFYLAQSYYFLHDFTSARRWYARRAEMGGWDEEVYFAMSQIPVMMELLGEPWRDVEDAYLKAWNFRPVRAEPLYAIAVHYRNDGQYQLGYKFAKRAAEIPFPEADELFTRPDIHTWRAGQEQAICAAMLGNPAESFALFRQLLARPGIPEEERQRIAGNRDVCVPSMVEAAASYPAALARGLVAGKLSGEVVVSLIAGPERTSTEHSLNSFLHCCTDVSRAGRFLAIDAGLRAADRALLLQRYPFLEFVSHNAVDGPGAQFAALRRHIDRRFWLHLGQGWRFFAPQDFMGHLVEVLEAEAQVFQVGINFADAVKPTGTCAPEQAVRRTPTGRRYTFSSGIARGPAMFETARLVRAEAGSGVDLRTASLDEVLCLAPTPTPRRRELVL